MAAKRPPRQCTNAIHSSAVVTRYTLYVFVIISSTVNMCAARCLVEGVGFVPPHHHCPKTMHNMLRITLNANCILSGPSLHVTKQFDPVLPIVTETERDDLRFIAPILPLFLPIQFRFLRSSEARFMDFKSRSLMESSTSSCPWSATSRHYARVLI